MAIDRKRFQGDRKRVVKVMAAKDDGEVEQIDLAIWHKPITPSMQVELDAIRDEINAQQIVDEESADQDAEKRERKVVLVAHLAHVLTRWDIVDDRQPLPITTETLNSFEYEFLAAISDEIIEPLYPKSTT